MLDGLDKWPGTVCYARHLTGPGRQLYGDEVELLVKVLTYSKESKTLSVPCFSAHTSLQFVLESLLQIRGWCDVVCVNSSRDFLNVTQTCCQQSESLATRTAHPRLAGLLRG